MYGRYVEPDEAVCRDPWHRGLYGVRLSVHLAAATEDVDAALRRAGYEARDIDQWGRSYVFRLDPCREAELDEGADFEGEVRLVLSRYGLARSETDAAAEDLRQMYDRILLESAREAETYCYGVGPRDRPSRVSTGAEAHRS
jgi:hypothetical protein